MLNEILNRIYRVLTSNGLATVLILLLFLLTLLGTIEQKDKGIFEVQKKYFEPLVLTYQIADTVPIPLPGAYLLMILLTVNVILGGIVKVRYRPRKIGVYVIHAGIVLLFLSGFFIYQGTERGTMSVLEGDTNNTFVYEHDWEIAIFPLGMPGSYTELLIPQEDFDDLEDDPRRFTSDEIPFDLELSRFWLSPDGERTKLDARLHLPDREEAEEFTLAGGGQHAPVITVGNRRWSVQLRRRLGDLPFVVRLDEFKATFHPGVNMPKAFRSEVTLLEPAGDEISKASIYMNHPLRRAGFTLYQHQYGEAKSVFEVVKNPADQYPLYATIVIGLGLTLHFIIRLVFHLIAQSRRRTT